ncbi:alpha/beta fold hydrolase [Gimesia chilikensis]|jgi:pimeloyl-ACP methyl ester carboxylesterase|uniref:Prolyl oligopeptidase family protein n=1 Tax=Gimesia chilikensis TaxID=2605989 RepID=A0A517PJV7_9PLAN|nr:alpha/beta fold hydrolase [Gimesia chilikensis]QDT19637.1 Prolyl oligopeptidase family protein [Gimesia chilikensis]
MQLFYRLSFIPLLIALFVYPGHAADPSPQKPVPLDIEFTARCDQTTQRYVLLLPEQFSTEKPHSLLIALHGHGSDRWQFVKDPRGECRASRDIARQYNLIYVSPDYRARTSWMGPKAEADLQQIIEELKSKYQIDQVFLCGGSMGGSSSLTFAALHPELIAGVAAMNPTANHLEYNNFQPAIQASFGGTKQQIPAEFKKRSSEYWPEKLTMPLSISVGGKDTSVPPDSARRLINILKQLNREVLLIDRPNEGHKTSYEDSRAILEFVIQRAISKKDKPAQ